MLQWILIILEIILVIAFTAADYVTKKPYKDWLPRTKAVWRIIVTVPLIAIAALSLGLNFTLFTLLILIDLAVILAADILLIYNDTFGMIGFLICHVLNSVNLVFLNHDFGYFQWITGGAVLSFGIFFYLLTLLGKLKGIMNILTPIYLLIIIFAVWRSYVMFFGANQPFALAISVGMTLFLFCDMQVTYEVFAKAEISHALNNILYYGGLIAIACSTMLI